MALVTRSRSRPAPTLSSDPTSSLREAIDDFKKALTVDQELQLHATAQVPCASSVLAFVTQIDENNNGRAGRCVSSRLCNFLDATQQFSSIVGTFASSNPATAALVWGSVKFAILAASNISSYFEKVTALLMGLGKFCPTYEKFAHLFPGCADLQNALCGYYAVIVRLSIKILEVSQRTALAQAFSSVWTPFESEFKPLQDNIRQASKAVQLSISLASQMAIQQVSEDQKANYGWTKTFFNGTRHAKAEREARKLRLAVKENLSKIDHMRPWRQAQRDRVGGTAEWFREDLNFQDWECSDRSCTLWCSGTMGIGKTILASQIIAHLFNTRKQSDVIAFHFCRVDENDSLLVRNIFGSLARQMLDIQLESAKIDELQKWCDSSKDMGESDLANFMSEHLDKRLTYHIIVDGLDECEKQDVLLLTRNLTRMIGTYSGCLKVIYVSRPELGSIVSKVARPTFEFSITKEKNRSDRRIYIEAKLTERLEDQRLELSNPALVATISDALENGSEGMFLWTRLLIDELCEQNSDNEILDTLKRLPRTMSELLDRKLRRIERRNKGAKKALQVLEYCGVVKRPLTSEEFRDLLGVSIGQEAFDSGALPNDMDRIINDCSGLVFVDEEEYTVHYVHHSIKDYLFAKSRPSSTKFVEEDSILHLSFLILTYANFSDFERQLTKARNGLDVGFRPIDLGVSSISGSSRTKARLAQIILELRRKNPSLPHKELARTGSQILATSNTSNEVHESNLLELRFPFLNYARKYWIYHVARLNPENHVEIWTLFNACVNGSNPFLMRPYQRDEAEVKSLISAKIGSVGKADKSSRVSILDPNDATYIAKWALQHGIGALVLHQMEFEQSNLPAEMKQEILWSIVANHPTLITSLLKNLYQSDNMLKQVLVYAAKSGNLAMVQTLIPLLSSMDNLVHMNGFSAYYDWCRDEEHPLRTLPQQPFSPDTSSALIEAAREGHFEIVKHLHRAGAGAELEEYCSALEAAASADRFRIVDYLLDTGLDFLREKTNVKWWLLFASAKASYVYATRWLLKGIGPRALYTAASRGQSKEVGTMLAAGARVDARDPSTNETALQAALSKRHIEVIKQLVAAGGNLRLDLTQDGQISFYVAAEAGHDTELECLLAAGAKVDARNDRGLTALQIAAKHGHVPIVKQLLAAGASWQELMYTAVEEDHHPIVDTLIAGGANVNTNAGPFGEASLYAAARAGHSMMVDRLIKAGADINASLPGSKNTALHVAAREDHYKVVDRLIKAGANVNAQSAGSRHTALYVAAERGHCDLVKRLIEAGANVHTALGDCENAALYVAAREGRYWVVNELLKAGAKPNHRKTRYMKSALFIAREWNHSEIADLLSCAGASGPV